MVLRRNGGLYEVSPWALSWDNENYYMVAYDSNEDKIKHFRVDKMLHLNVTKEVREGKEQFREFDMAVYARKTFGMFGGEEQEVKLQCENRFAGVIIDRFGKDISFRPAGDGYSEIAVDVNVSPQFLGWMFSLGKDVKVTGPDSVVEQVKEAAKEFMGNYI